MTPDIRAKIKEHMIERLKDIKDGTFMKEWVAEEKAGHPQLKKMIQEGLEHPINRYEESAAKKFKKSVFPNVLDYDELAKQYKRI
jgi:ketol-acid reductoisomerase